MLFLVVITSLVKTETHKSSTKILKKIVKNLKPSQVTKAKYKISSAQMIIFTATKLVCGFKVLITQSYMNIFN